MPGDDGLAAPIAAAMRIECSGKLKDHGAMIFRLRKRSLRLSDWLRAG
jgi:hypothetical protein